MDVDVANKTGRTFLPDDNLEHNTTDDFSLNSHVHPQPAVNDHFDAQAGIYGLPEAEMETTDGPSANRSQPACLSQVPGFEDFNFDNNARGWPVWDRVDGLNVPLLPRAAPRASNGSQPATLPANIEDLIRHWELEAGARGFDAVQRARMHNIMRHRLNIINNPPPRTPQTIANLNASFDHMQQFERQALDNLDQPYRPTVSTAWGHVQTDINHVPDLYHNIRNPDNPTWAMPAQFRQRHLFYTSPTQPRNAAANLTNASSMGTRNFHPSMIGSDGTMNIDREQATRPSNIQQQGSTNDNTQASDLARYRAAITTDHGSRIRVLQQPSQNPTGQGPPPLEEHTSKK